MQNIFLDFKNEIGFINATSQYTELIIKVNDEILKMPKEELEKIARENQLTITDIPAEAAGLLSKNAITSIYSVFESFIKKYNSLPGTKTYGKRFDRSTYEQENELEWCLDEIYGSVWPKEVQDLYCVVHYYRLVRNQCVHRYVKNLKENIRIATERMQQIDKQYFVSKVRGDLHIPQNPNEVVYDDQIIFSRAAIRLAEHIFDDTEYDIDQIIDCAFEDIELRASVKKKAKPHRRRSVVINTLKYRYPQKFIEGKITMLELLIDEKLKNI